MALTIKLDKEAHGKLPDVLKKEYKADGEGFVLDLTDLEDTGPLKRAHEREKETAKEAKAKLKELTAQLETLTTEREEMLKGNVPKGDVVKLEESYKGKLAAREKELSTEIATLQGTMQTMLVDNVALSIATEISTAPALILPHIKARLKAEKNGDKYETRVLKDGAVSALTVDDLKKEFVLNKDFAAIITGSKASGGGAGGGKGGGGAGASGKIDFTKSPKEIAAQMRAQGKAPEVTT